MAMKVFRKIAAALLFAVAASPAEAAMSEWQDMGGGRARLVAELDPASNRVAAAVEIELKDGWKTYWRQPGASGIPPILDFSRSAGFEAGEVQLPAPKVLTAGEAHFAGYKGATAFYFEGQALGVDSVIRLDLMAGVCEEICIPAQASFEMPVAALMASDPKAAMVLEMARSQLPGKAHDGFGVKRSRRHADGSLDVEATLPEGAKPGLFVEGPQGWYFPMAELVSEANGTALFRIGSPERPRDADANAKLRFTLTDGSSAVEQWLSPEN